MVKFYPHQYGSREAGTINEHPLVNGKEISTAVQDEMIEIFKNEKDHVVVQVLRKNACTRRVPSVDVGTQTDPPDSYTDVEHPAFRSTPVSDGRHFLHRPPDRHYDADEYLPCTPHDVESECDPVYEVTHSYVTIQRRPELSTSGRYRHPTCSDLPDLLSSKEMELFKLKYYQELILGISSCYTINEEQPSTSPNKTDDDSKANRNATPEPSSLQDRDSGVGCMDESTQNEEASEHDTKGEGSNCDSRWEPGCSGDLIASRESPLRDSITSDECSDSGFYSISPREYERFQKVLEKKCRQYTSRSKSDLGRKTPTEEETKNKQENDATNKLDQAQEGQEGDGFKNCKTGERTDLTERPPARDQPKSPQTRSTSNDCCHGKISAAANRSKSFKEENTIVPLKSCPNKALQPLSDPISGTPNKEANCTADSALVGENIEGRKEKNKTGQEPSSVRRYNHELDSYLSPYHTSSQKSVHIPQHARHYQSYMQLVQQETAVECNESLSEAGEGDGEMSSPVSRLEDGGTCFTTKKQLRDQLLKDRAVKIGEERNGVTTDDDALSEIKMGRYWNKVERRQHLTLAKEKRRRREVMMQSRLGIVKESGGNGRKESNIVELSQRKVTRKRNKKVFDNWVTIQELLAHGSRSADGTMVYSPLLSVTTV
ncbi:PDZ domain-containing RING finger protein 4-like [Heptranchias perlo]|uniref:PDZ domain-containing RING finger protein 4-like n=1 Tax=Heptranchias perlo TaxID=212740 RepID=UPI00355A43A3